MRGTGAARRRGGGRGGGREAGRATPGNLIDRRVGQARRSLPMRAAGAGWPSRTSAEAQRPLYNQAKEKLLQDKQVTSVTISSFQPERYCEAQKALGLRLVRDAARTLSFNEVQRMIGACPGVGRRADDSHA